jgi:hypothetical protein
MGNMGNKARHSTAMAPLPATGPLAGPPAQYYHFQINGQPGYTFMLTAVDGNLLGGTSPDLFRLKIWGSGGVIYDNNIGADDNSDPTTALGGGSIIIHKQ